MLKENKRQSDLHRVPQQEVEEVKQQSDLHQVPQQEVEEVKQQEGQGHNQPHHQHRAEDHEGLEGAWNEPKYTSRQQLSKGSEDVGGHEPWLRLHGTRIMADSSSSEAPSKELSARSA